MWRSWLLAVVVAVGGSYPDRVVREVVGRSAGLYDARTKAPPAATSWGRIDTLVGEYAREGLSLRIVLVDSGPRFSLGDFAARLWRALDGGTEDVLILATSSGVHVQAPWFKYADARSLSRKFQAAYRSDPVAGLADFGLAVLGEGQRRAKRRRLMLAVGMVALTSLLILFGRAGLRRRRTPLESASTSATD